MSLLPLPGASPKGREATYVVADLEPGARTRRQVRVCNGTGSPVRVSLYANAAGIQDGGFLPLGSPRADNELSRWNTVAPASVVLQPNRPVDVAVTVEVPDDAEPGERYAVVYAEVPPAPGGTGVGVASRVGVREYVLVRGDQPPRTDFTVESLTAARDAQRRPVVQAAVRNTGERALDIAGQLALSDGPGGVSAGPFPATVGTTLAPGQSAPVQVLLDPMLPAGPWRARLDLSSGGTQRAAEATITFPDEAGGTAAPVPAKNLPLREDPSVVIPVAVGIFSLAALLLLLVLYRRRSKAEDGGPAPAR